MFRVDTHICNCELTAEVLPEVLCEPLPADIKFACYLFCGKEICVKDWYQKERTFHFPLDAPGSYFVRVYARWKPAGQGEYTVKIVDGKRLRFVGKELLEEYREFLHTGREIELPTLPYTKLEYPKQDLLIAAVRSGDPAPCREAMEALGSKMSFHVTPITPAVTALSRLLPFCEGGRYVIFSGMGRTGDRLISGMEDMESWATAEALSEQIGTFSLMRSDGETLTLETDFAGTDKLYYYTSSHVFLASNRVHLILLAMKEMKIARKPNMTRIYAGLCHSFITRQNFCQELNVEGLIALRADSRVRIDLSDQSVRVEKTSLHSVLSTPIPYKEETYRSLLNQAAEEIVDNLRIALEHHAFDTLVLHVTGGMDSRAVLCALSRLPQYKHKVVAKTVKTQPLEDFEVAMKLLSKFRLPLGGFARKTGASYTTNWIFESLSTQLAATPEFGKTLDPMDYLPGERICLLPGAFGEAYSRAYISKPLFDRPLGDSTLSDREFAALLTELANGNSYTIFDAREELRDTLVRECMSLPGTSNLEKYENLYLFYRNGLHFNTAYDYHPFAPFWGVLQSKALLQLRVMTYHTPHVNALEMDLLYVLNPELASVEFESPKHNALREALDQKYHRYPTCSDYDEAVICELKQEWEENEKSQPKSKAETLAPPVQLRDMDLLLGMFYTLVTRLGLREEAGSGLYSYLKPSQQRRRSLMIIAKLYSLYYELFL